MEGVVTMNEYKLNKLHLINYKVFDDKVIEFNRADLIVLDGPNGYGKTSIFEAIEYVITGSIKRAEQCPEVSGKIAYSTHFLANDSSKDVKIKGEFISGENKIEIERTIKVESISGLQNNPKNLKSVTETRIFIDNIEVDITSLEGVDKIIGKNLGENLGQYYDKFYYISQEDRLNFLMDTDERRMKEISSLFNIDDEIKQYEKYIKLRNSLAKKIKALKQENKEERKVFEEFKGGLKENKTDKRPYKNLFPKCGKKIYLNENIVKIKDKAKLEEMLIELKEIALLSRNKLYFESDLFNSRILPYSTNPHLVKNILVFQMLEKKYKNISQIYETYEYLNNLPKIEHSDELNIEELNYSVLKEKLEIEDDIGEVLRIQNDIIKIRQNQNTYNKALEKLKNAKEIFSKNLEQWNLVNGNLTDNICPYCGTIFDSEEDYKTAIEDASRVLDDYSDLETKKIKEFLDELQNKFIDIFKTIINNFLEENSFMDNDCVKIVVQNIQNISGKLNDLSSLLKKENVEIGGHVLDLMNEDSWNNAVSNLLDIMKEKCIKKLPDNFNELQNENRFSEHFINIYDGDTDKIDFISEDDENEKRLYLEEQYQLQEYEKVDEKEKELLKKEKLEENLADMKEKVGKLVSIFKNEIGKYEKKIIGEIQIPLYIYSGRILQYYQGGLGIYIKTDVKKEKLYAIRFLSSNQSDHDVLYTMSSGQLTGVVISLTLTLNKIYGTDKFACILIDDPVQTMDDLNIASLVEVLRGEFKDYQMIVSTHEEDFSRFIRYKYDKYNLTTQRCRLNE